MNEGLDIIRRQRRPETFFFNLAGDPRFGIYSQNIIARKQVNLDDFVTGNSTPAQLVTLADSFVNNLFIQTGTQGSFPIVVQLFSDVECSVNYKNIYVGGTGVPLFMSIPLSFPIYGFKAFHDDSLSPNALIQDMLIFT